MPTAKELVTKGYILKFGLKAVRNARGVISGSSAGVTIDLVVSCRLFNSPTNAV